MQSHRMSGHSRHARTFFLPRSYNSNESTTRKGTAHPCRQTNQKRFELAASPSDSRSKATHLQALSRSSNSTSPPAKVPVAHSHDAYEETIYGLSGTFTIQGQKTEIGPGDSICIPRGAIHRFDNLHSTEAKTLVMITPGILGPDYFREIASVLKAAGAPPDPAAIAAVMQRHGLTPAP